MTVTRLLVPAINVCVGFSHTRLFLPMPLLALFSRKNRSSSKVSTTAYSNSNVSLDDDEYVSVTAPTGPISYHAQSPASSSKLPLPLRRMRELTPVQSQFQYSDPLLDPPPRRSSIFQTYQDDSNSFGSTRSLPGEAGRPPALPKPLPQQPSTPRLSSAPKKSMFPWSSHKERGKSVSPAKPGSTEADASFNLKSFRHVRPDSPGLGSPGRRTPSPAPPVVPIPTTALPSPPVAFQVTSRRPRADSVSELANPGSSPQTASQQKMAAGAFRQAARRSTTSLSLGDSPVLSPIQTSLDDRPPLSLLPSLTADTQSPPRSSTQPPSTTYTQKLVTSPISPISSNFTSSSQSRSAATPSPKPTPVSKPPRARTNAFANTSSSSSSSEEEDEEDESTSDAGAGVGASRISRRRTIKQSQSQPPTLPPLSSSVRQQIQRSMPPASSSSMFEHSSVAAKEAPRPQSSLGLGTRPRASLSVGALTPTAKEARANIALAANARLPNCKLFFCF